MVGWVEKLSLLIRHQRGDWQIINNNWVNLKRGCLLFPFGPYGCMSSSLNRQGHSFRKMSIFNNCCVKYVHLILLERTGLKAIWSLVWYEANLTCFICNQCRPRKPFFMSLNCVANVNTILFQPKNYFPNGKIIDLQSYTSPGNNSQSKWRKKSLLLCLELPITYFTQRYVPFSCQR